MLPSMLVCVRVRVAGGMRPSTTHVPMNIELVSRGSSGKDEA